MKGPVVVCLTFLWSLCSCVAVRPEFYDQQQGAQNPLIADSKSRFLNDRSAKFAVDGTNFPHVPLDIEESYAGLIPISTNQSDTQQLYFWFFPSNNPLAGNEITVWLNGGPGCSSLLGLLEENGKFQWQPGQYGPGWNDWAWTKLTNVVWIDQPVGAGFAQGKPTAVGTEELAPQFMGFWKNFIDTFEMTGSKVYLTGESYAGQYIPYFASAMLDANDTDYFDVQGTMLIDPAFSSDVALVELPFLSFAEAKQPILRFNDSFRAYIEDLHANEFNYTDFFEEYLKFPTLGPMPVPPNADESDSPFRSILSRAAASINPCFNVYHITDSCPRPFDPLGVNGPLPEFGFFFDLPEVKAAMHAPNVPWKPCRPPSEVFASADGQDQSLRPSFTVLPGVFERVPLNIVANGALDFIIPSMGVMFALQNITWAGNTGFEKRPNQTFVVPASPYWRGGAAGEMGSWGWERGVLFVDVEGAGHMLPADNPSAAFRLLEVLLGRVGVEDGMRGAAWTA